MIAFIFLDNQEIEDDANSLGLQSIILGEGFIVVPDIVVARFHSIFTLIKDIIFRITLS